ncbi:MAG: flagellar hook-basal body protein [Desulfobacterales bacterium]
MISGIYNLIDGSMTQQLRFETIANNIANSNTNGFKKDIISFNQTLDMQSISKTDFSQGPIRYTGNELDIAMGAKGFLKIETPNGLRYTRDGALSIDAEGYLVTGNGDKVLGENGPITVEGGTVSIERDGQVFVDNETVDKLLVVSFDKPEQLRKEGGSYYSYQGESKEISTETDGVIQQRYLEGSNVNPTQEMIEMIETFRTFESVEKAIQSLDGLTGKMVNDYGQVP